MMFFNPHTTEKSSSKGGSSMSNLSKSLNDTTLEKNEVQTALWSPTPLGFTPLLLASGGLTPTMESFPVSLWTTDLKLVTSVSTYCVSMNTILTFWLIHKTWIEFFFYVDFVCGWFWYYERTNEAVLLYEKKVVFFELWIELVVPLTVSEKSWPLRGSVEGPVQIGSY